MEPTEPEQRAVEAEGAETADGKGGGTSRTPVTQQLGRIAVLAAAVVFVIFALDNAQHVDFSWVFGESRVVERDGARVAGGVRLIVLLGVAFVVGASVGGLVTRMRARRRR